MGIGNQTVFDLLDGREEDRVLRRIKEQDPFPVLDLALNIHYTVEDRKRHSARGDGYIVRFSFQPGNLELLIHHLRGIKRTAPDELVRLLVEMVNLQLGRKGRSELRLSSLIST